MMKEASGAKKQRTVAESTKKNDRKRTKGSTGNRKTKGKSPAKKKCKRQHKSENDSSSEDDDSCPCLICGETYSRPKEKWIQCQDCKLWAHLDCTDGGYFFTCPNCNSDDDM